MNKDKEIDKFIKQYLFHQANKAVNVFSLNFTKAFVHGMNMDFSKVMENKTINKQIESIKVDDLPFEKNIKLGYWIYGLYWKYLDEQLSNVYQINHPIFKEAHTHLVEIVWQCIRDIHDNEQGLLGLRQVLNEVEPYKFQNTTFNALFKDHYTMFKVLNQGLMKYTPIGINYLAENKQIMQCESFNVAYFCGYIFQNIKNYVYPSTFTAFKQDVFNHALIYFAEMAKTKKLREKLHSKYVFSKIINLENLVNLAQVKIDQKYLLLAPNLILKN